MEPAEPQHVFIRNASGQVWGPVALPNVEELFESGQVSGPVEVSQDGVTYVEPGRMPSVRGAFPRDTWGTVEVPAEKAPAASPPPASAPMAGPGAMAAAAARAARTAGPHRAAVPAGKPAASPARPATAAAAAPSPAGPAASGDSPPAHVPTPVPEKDPPPASGELGKLSSIHLYYLAASSDQSGLLSFKLSDRTIEVHFRKGSPEHVSSNHPDDSLQQFLRHQANVSAAQLETAQGSLEKFGGDLIAALFGLGILNPGTAFVQLVQRATGMLLKALLVEHGTFTYELKELPAAKAMPLGNRWAVLSEQVRRIPVSEMRRRLQDSMDLPLMKSGGRIPAADLRLTPQETRALALVDGLRSLNQLAKALPADADTFARLAFYLRELEILSFAALRAPAPKAPPPAAEAPGLDPTGSVPAAAQAQAAAPSAPSLQQVAAPSAAQPQAAVPPSPGAAAPPPAASSAPPPQAVASAPAHAAAPPHPVGGPAARPSAGPNASAPRPAVPPVAAKPPAPAAPKTPLAPSAKNTTPAPTLRPEEEIAQLVSKVARLKDMTLFEVLDLKENADSSSVKASYFKLARMYHPDTVAAGAPPELSKLKGEIFAKIGEAYKTLGDDKSRAEYLDVLKNGGAGEVDIASILLSEELFQKATILVKGKRFADAVRLLDDAIGGNPEEGEFYAWRGYAKFFLHEDKKVAMQEARNDLQICLQKNERVAQAHYFLGSLTKLTGDTAGAQKHFKRTLELRPDHVDAQREVRLAVKK